LIGFASSLDLYFRKFEFNASIYYLARHFGQLIFGYNIIAYLGPLLSLVFIYIIIKLSYRFGMNDWCQSQMFLLAIMLFTAHLLLSTTIHPWYLITILFFNVFHSYKYVLVWSFFILLSYSNYHGIEYNERLWVIILEYLVVLFSFLVFDKGLKLIRNQSL
jgi:hypothetical protein